MAGRFLFRELSSGMSRSTRSLLGAHASDSAMAASEPVTRRRASEGAIRTLGNLCNGASAHPNTAVPSNHGIHCYAARYFNTLSCTRAASKRRSPASGMPSVTTYHMKPEYVDSVRVKRTFSSTPSSQGTVYWEHKVPSREAELEAKWKAIYEAGKAACEAESAACLAKWKAEDAAFIRFVTILVVSWCLIGLCWISMLDAGSSSPAGTSSCEGQSSSHCVLLKLLQVPNQCVGSKS